MQGVTGGQGDCWKQQGVPDVPGYGSSGRNVRLVQKLEGEEQATEKLGGEDEEWGDKGSQVEIDWTVPNLPIAGVGHTQLASMVVP